MHARAVPPWSLATSRRDAEIYCSVRFSAQSLKPNRCIGGMGFMSFLDKSFILLPLIVDRFPRI